MFIFHCSVSNAEEKLVACGVNDKDRQQHMHLIIKRKYRNKEVKENQKAVTASFFLLFSHVKLVIHWD